MNLSMWTAIREYIAAEIQLTLARARSTDPSNDSRVRSLEEQSTRMETSVREHVARLEGEHAQAQALVRRHTKLR